MTDRPRAQLVPLRPYGAGSGEVEALTSVLMRMAEHHCVLTSRIIRGVLFRDDIVKKGHKPAIVDSIWRPSANGYGAAAEMTVTRTASAAGVDYRGSTLLALKDVLSPVGAGLVDVGRRWCPECYLADRANGRRPYIRLYWCVPGVSVCVQHRLPLEWRCAHCGEAQCLVPRLPFSAHCGTCGSDLTRVPGQLEEPSEFELWASGAIHELIATQQRIGDSAGHDRFLEWLKGICNHFEELGNTSLAELTGQDRSNFRRWTTGEAKPKLSALIKFCFAIRCPPASILTGQHSLLELHRPRPVQRPAKQASRNWSAARVAALKAHLDEIISGERPLPNSIYALARELEILPSFLNHRFPDEKGRIQALAKAAREAKAEKVRSSRMLKLREGLEALMAAGVYPSNKNIRQHLGLSGSALYDPYLRVVIDEARAKFVEQNDFAPTVAA